MAKELFIENVRSAVSSVLPRVDAEHPYTAREELERLLRRDDLWLRKNSVGGFDPGDFIGLEDRERGRLEWSVESFLRAAGEGIPSQPSAPHRTDAALPPFLEIVEIVRKAVLDEWGQAARKLTDQAELWAKEKSWPTDRFAWELTERFLGTYELDQLVFEVEGSQMALVPVGRFLRARGGSFDLAVMPAYESVGVVRGPGGKWLIKPLPGDNKLTRWGRGAFVEASEKLSRMG
jgi:hypothetical protein